MKYLKIFIIAAALILILVPGVSAQSFSMSLHPEKHAVISKPGQIIILPYSLSNVGDPQVLSLKIYKLVPSSNSENYELTAYEETQSSPQFAVINAAMELNKPFLMNGKSTVLFDVEITVPENAQLKDYYFTFVAESEGLKGAEGTTSIQLEGGVGSHILLTVTDSGHIENSAQITRFDIPSSRSITLKGQKYYFVNSTQAVPFSLTIKNLGQNFINTTGTINSASGVPLKLPGKTILSGSQKTISSSPELSPNKIIGLEKITAAIQIGNSQVIYASANIIVIPTKMLIVLGCLLILASSIYYFIKTRKKK